jgi:RNA polymerase sigma factor (sigma-70 family)
VPKGLRRYVRPEHGPGNGPVRRRVCAQFVAVAAANVKVRMIGTHPDPAAPAPGAESAHPSNTARTYLSDRLLDTGAGDREAFREVYALTSAKLFGICLGICLDHQGAEDVLHDVYITVWKRAETWETGRASPITWLATIARNRAIDWKRSQSRRQTVHLDDAPEPVDETPAADISIIWNDSVSRLNEQLLRLSPRQQNAIRAAYFDGKTYAELALLEGIPLGTMKSWIRRGLGQLKAELQIADVG